MQHHFSVILEETSHTGNIGACARAMKTMRISDLRLINCVSHEQSDTYARASGADDILFHAQTFSDLPCAIKDRHLIFGMSGRKRHNHKHCIEASQIPSIIANQPNHTNIGLLFGNEQNGLSNASISHCHYQVCIPTNPAFSSLNLASAVQLICYICTTDTKPTTQICAKETLTSHKQSEALVSTILQLLKGSKYDNPQTLSQTTQRIRQLILHSPFEETDIDLIIGLLKAIIRQSHNDK